MQKSISNVNLSPLLFEAKAKLNVLVNKTVKEYSSKWTYKNMSTNELSNLLKETVLLKYFVLIENLEFMIKTHGDNILDISEYKMLLYLVKDV